MVLYHKFGIGGGVGKSGFICNKITKKCEAGGTTGTRNTDGINVYSSIDECQKNESDCPPPPKSNTTIIFIIVGILMLLALIAFAIIQYKTRDAFK